uniref:FRIGIDA-like protein n=1 Tax=Fagus sylvatica TaxID=28930 RepID=A0A2N9HFR9_FAGSY
MPSKLDKDKVCADLPLPQPPQSLRKSFKLLKTHAASVANFTLQWQDLEDHFVAIHNSIQSKLHQLQPNQTHLTPTLQSQPNSQKTQIDSKETILIPTLESQPICKETQLSSALESQGKSKKTQVKNEESLPENEYLNGIPIYNGKALLLYLKEHLREHESMRNDIYNALKVSVDSGKLVFEAVRWYHLQEMKEDRDIGVSVLRRSCVLLLEELMRVGPVVKAEVREEAVKLALEWKEKVGEEMENSWEVLRFLLLVAAFGLMAEFDGDEILKLLIGIVPRKIAPELFRALGFADKAPGMFQRIVLAF